MYFATELELREVGEAGGRSVYSLINPLIYVADNGERYIVPVGFQTDLASVPRVPLLYGIWGDRAHREAVLHDFLFRFQPSMPLLSFKAANRLFLEAMKSRKVKWWIRIPMYWGVCLGGRSSYHKLFVNYKFFPDINEIY